MSQRKCIFHHVPSGIFKVLGFISHWGKQALRKTIQTKSGNQEHIMTAQIYFSGLNVLFKPKNKEHF
jgi:hypothetical protein